ncbi:aspartate 1-decarboxylase [bacterium]|nr:aspartate 1-decarboxylase [bacterium]RQV93302.1 MAG: aspartate 1-decarboxylase [bacterium]
MFVQLLRAKIHRARVTDANLNYEGSLTIDETLMEAAGIYTNEKVQVVNISNGSRAETYVITGKRDSGEIVMNGAIARLAQIGDLIIILSYGLVDESEVNKCKPTTIVVDKNNRIIHKK